MTNKIIFTEKALYKKKCWTEKLDSNWMDFDSSTSPTRECIIEA